VGFLALRFVVRDDAAPGSAQIVFDTTQSGGRPPVPVFEPYILRRKIWGESAREPGAPDCRETGRFWEYELGTHEDTSIVISGPDTPDDPPPLDPRDAAIRFVLGDAGGDPGEVVRVPIKFRSEVDLYQIRPVLGFDTSRLTLEGFEVPVIDPSGDPAEPELLTLDLDGGVFVNEACEAVGGETGCTAGLPFIGTLHRVPPDELPAGHLIVDLQTTYIAGQGGLFPGPLAWEAGEEHVLGTALFRIRADAPLGPSSIEGVSVRWRPETSASEIVSESSGYPILDFASERADVPSLEVVGAVVTIGPPQREFIRGDADLEGGVELTDAVYTLNHLFLGGPALPCADAGDVDDDGVLNITDAVYTLSFLFLGGPPPAAPYPEAGLDPTEDGLTCPLEIGG